MSRRQPLWTMLGTCIATYTCTSLTHSLPLLQPRLDRLLSSIEPLQKPVSKVCTCLSFASYCSAQHVVFSTITDSIRHSRHNQTSIGYCLGGSNLTSDTYVIVITGRESVGHLASHEIWRLTKFEIIPLRLAKGQAIQVQPSLCKC